MCDSGFDYSSIFISQPHRHQMVPVYFLLYLLTSYGGRIWATEGIPQITSGQWLCEGCADKKQSDLLLKLTYKAASNGDRLSYLALDMSWLDRLAESSSSLKIYLKKYEKIADIVEIPVFAGNEMPSNETYYAMAFHLENPSDDSSKSSRVSRFQKSLDTFMAINPCWIPLLQPSVSSFYKKKHFMIFIRLPEKSFRATCKLFTAIVDRQFPKVCKYDADHLASHNVSNIGFGHTSLHLMLGMATTLVETTKVFTAPIADTHMSRQNLSYVQGVDPYLNPQLWAWADPNLCDLEVFRNDPWACNFIPFTNCSTRDLMPNVAMKSNVLSRDILNKNFIESKALRVKYDDQKELSNYRWFETRMFAFTLRPNAQLRQKLLTSLRAVRKLSSNGQHIKENSSKKNGGIIKQSSCGFIHVRNNDAMSDARGGSGVDRTLEGLERHLSNFSDTKNIFLATDNRTVVEIATRLYPNYTWYSQLRPMSNTSDLYRVFTATQKYYSLVGTPIYTVNGHETNGQTKIYEIDENIDDNVSNIGGYSVQKDLSHLLADVRYATQCTTMIGSHDSTLSGLIFSTMCGTSKTGVCPASIDIVNTHSFMQRRKEELISKIPYSPIPFQN